MAGGNDSDSGTVAGVAIPRPDKLLFPADEISKLDLAHYYAGVADLMLPYLADRPINMQRFPDGIDGPAFFEKRTPKHFPDWISRVHVRVDKGPRGEQDQPVVTGVRTLVYLVGQACIAPHTWLSRKPRLDRPDQLIVDLDPSVDDLAKVRRAAAMTGELLDELGLPGFLKTTGSRGYHVVVPLRAGDDSTDFDDVRAFARDLAWVLVSRAPDLLTLEQRKAKRGDRVLLDIGRNGYGQTAVPAYAVRARPGAPVSTPIAWDELHTVEPTSFTIRNLSDRIGSGSRSAFTDPWYGLRRRAHGLNAAAGRLGRLVRAIG